MKPEAEWNRRIQPLPWHRVVIGENDCHEPVCVIRDADGHAVAEYLAVGDADLIVLAVNKEKA